MPPRTVLCEVPHRVVIVVDLALRLDFVGPIHDLPHCNHVFHEAYGVDPELRIRNL